MYNVLLLTDIYRIVNIAYYRPEGCIFVVQSLSTTVAVKELSFTCGLFSDMYYANACKTSVSFVSVLLYLFSYMY